MFDTVYSLPVFDTKMIHKCLRHLFQIMQFIVKNRQAKKMISGKSG